MPVENAAPVENTERVSAHLGRWNPSDLVFVEDVAFASAPGETSAVRMTALFQRRDPGGGGPDLDGAFLRVRMRFDNVRHFHLGPVSGPLRLDGFDIVDVRDRGWEGVRLEVEDYEQGVLSFCCATAAVVEVEPVPRLPSRG